MHWPHSHEQDSTPLPTTSLLPKQLCKLKVELSQIHRFQSELAERWDSLSLTALGQLINLPYLYPDCFTMKISTGHLPREGPMESESIPYWSRRYLLLCYLAFSSLPLTCIFLNMCMLWAHLIQVQIHWTNKGKHIPSYGIRWLPLMEAEPPWSRHPPLYLGIKINTARNTQDGNQGGSL